ncbi:MAG: sialate O-acetylesterase, partial [Catalinimonas sp.]
MRHHPLSLLLISMLLASGLRAEVRLPAFFADGMVLQRDRPVRVWGWADPHEDVTLQLADRSTTMKANAEGYWEATLGALPAGGPYELRVNDRTFRDVLMGDVWIASGQSNMEWKLSQLLPRYDSVLAAADFPQLRFLDVTNRTANAPLSDIETTGWQAASLATAPAFSAVAFFFARDLHRHLGVPIGVIQTEWGGTPAQAWTSAEQLRAQLPVYKQKIAEVEARADAAPVVPADPERALADWTARVEALDQGYRGDEARWARRDFGAKNWPTAALPAFWERDLGPYDGVV